MSSDVDGPSSSVFPESVYGPPPEYNEVLIHQSVKERDLITNGLLKTVSEMYFGCIDPFAEILRCLDNRIDPVSRRYVSGLETLLKNEILDTNNAKAKASKEKIIITPLDMLACPFRKSEVIDNWAPQDVALFELSVCECRGFNPKQMLPNFDGRKTGDDLTAFFDTVYSKSNNWKKIQAIINRDDLGVVKSEDMDVEPPSSTES
jgi:hypothetical protein